MLSTKELNFKIENNHLKIIDNDIDLNSVNFIEIRESSQFEGEYVIYVSTENSGSELGFYGDCVDVYDVFLWYVWYH